MKPRKVLSNLFVGAVLAFTSLPPAAWGSARQRSSSGATQTPGSFGGASSQWVAPLARLLAGWPDLSPRLQQRLAAGSPAQGDRSAAVLAPFAAALEEAGITPQALEQALASGSIGEVRPILESAALRARHAVERHVAALSRQALEPGLTARRLSRTIRELEAVQRDHSEYLPETGDDPHAASSALTRTIAVGRLKLGQARSEKIASIGRGVRENFEAGGDLESAPAVLAGDGANAAARPPASLAPRAGASVEAGTRGGLSGPAVPQTLQPLAPAAWAKGVFLPQLVERPLPQDPLGVTVHRLSNGMTVYLSPNRAEPRVYSEIAVRAGSRQDPLEATGMAHYLEHMQFKGSQRLGTLDYEKEKRHLDRIEALYDQLFAVTDSGRREAIYAEIDRESQAAAAYAIPNEFDKLYAAMGFTESNAHTSHDETVYQGSFPSNRAEVWAQIEADRLTDPVYRIFLPELETVYEEYNRGLDNPDAALYRAARRALFEGHPYGRSVIGLGEHLKNPSISRMREFFRANYRPNNMALILSGDFDRQDMLARLERSFGKLEPAVVPAPPASAVRPLHGVKRAELRFQAEEKVQIGWLLPGHNHPDADALALMDSLMDNRWTGILNLSVNKAQKVKESGAYPDISNEAGGWFVWAAPKDGQTLEQAEAILLDAVRALKAGDFTEGDLKAVIADLEVKQKKRLEQNGSRAGVIRESFINGEEWKDAAGLLERLKRVTKADILRVADRYLGEDRVVLYRRKGNPDAEKVSKPAFTAVPIDTAKQSAFFTEAASLPAAPLAPRFLRRGRDYKTIDRGWGRLYWTPNPVNDLFHLEFRFDRGSAQEPKLDLALKFLELSGAGDMTVEAFQRALYSMGSMIKVGVDEREVVVQLSGLEKNLEETLRLALLRFSQPNAAAGTFRRMIAIERGDRQDRKLDPGEIKDALEEFAQRGQGSSVLKELTQAQLKALTQAQLKGVLRSLFDYRRSALYTGSRGAADVAKILSNAQARRAYRRPRPAEPIKLLAPPRPRVVFIHRAGMKQALIGVYAGDGPFNPRARLDERLYQTLMGGGMSGAYFQEVRESRALAYTAQGGYEAGERAGDDNNVWSAAGTQADKAVQTAELLGQLMRHAPLSAERFAAARREVEENYRTLALQLDEIPRALHRWERLGLKGDPRAGAFKKLLRYDPEDLAKFAARFQSKPLTFYILGDRAGVDLAGLGKLGDFEERSVDELFPF